MRQRNTLAAPRVAARSKLGLMDLEARTAIKRPCISHLGRAQRLDDEPTQSATPVTSIAKSGKFGRATWSRCWADGEGTAIPPEYLKSSEDRFFDVATDLNECTTKGPRV